ncbi:DUF1684 domain-containing protein [Nocardia sp. NPDC004068]|uniref:DUF1684 domain-containing protein n=1 Tax=Nocardia sp. NPDC004068 TaxID=3364303 RepID=UPI0036C264FB
MTASVETWLTDWQRWHAERVALATGRHGTAALTGTHWLDDTPVAVDGVPGTWVARAGRAVGDGPGFHVELAPGEAHPHRELLLRALIRDGRVAVRVFDPQAPTRTGLLGIDAFDPDPAWVLTGTFETDPETLRLTHIDGFVSENSAARVRVSLGGDTVVLAGARTPDGGAQITFADVTNGVETDRFRFLTVAPPDADGNVELDFNRAHLPPCAFSDHYLCPLPPPGNRLTVPIRAGETRPRRGTESHR